MGQRKPNLNRTYSPNPWPLSVKQAASEAGVSVYIVRDWIRNGCPHRKMPGKKGRTTFKSIEAVNAWRAANGRLVSASKPEGGDGEQVDANEEEAKKHATLLEIQRKTGIENLRIKKLEAQKRIRVEALAKGDMLSKPECERRWLQRVQLVGAGLAGLPQRVAPLCVGRKLKAIERILEKAARELLEDYSRQWPS